MDLHIYRNSQDRWHDLKTAARERGAVLAFNAVTLDELVERSRPMSFSDGWQRLVICEFAPARGEASWLPHLTRYAADAISELKARRVRLTELRSRRRDHSGRHAAAIR